MDFEVRPLVFFIQKNVYIFAFGWSAGPKMSEEIKTFPDYILILFLAHLGDSPGVLLCIPNCAKGKNGSWRCTYSYYGFTILVAEMKSKCKFLSKG